VASAISQETKSSVLEIQVNAALAGHDLGPFDPVESFDGVGYQVTLTPCTGATGINSGSQRSRGNEPTNQSGYCLEPALVG